MTPLILTRFDKVELDLFYLLASANFLFVVFQGRLTDTFMKMLSYAFAGADDLSKWTEKRKLSVGEPNWPLFQRAYMAMGFFLFLAIIPATVFSAVAGWWSLGSLTGFNYERGWLWASLAVGVLSPALGLYFQRPEVALQATGRIAIRNRMNVLSSGLSVLAAVIVVQCGGRLFALIITQFLFTWIKRALLIWRLPKEVKKYSMKSRWDSEIYSWCKEPVFRGCVTVFAGIGIQRTLGIFLASTGIPGFASPFLFAQMVLLSGEKIAYAPLQSQMPRFSKMLAQGQRRELLVDALPRIFFVTASLLALTAIVAFTFPYLFKIIGAQISFLPVGLFVLLGLLRSIYSTQLGFNRVQSLTNDILVMNRFLLAIPLALIFFFIGTTQKNYLWFVLGAYIPQILVLNIFTLRKFLELGDLSLLELSSRASSQIWNRRFAWLHNK